MDQYHALHKTMDQYHGKQIIGSPYKYNVKVSPQQLFNFLFLNFSILMHHTYSTPLHVVCWVYTIHSLIQFPFAKPKWRKLENQVVGANRPHPQMVAVAHFIKISCICFII